MAESTEKSGHRATDDGSKGKGKAKPTGGTKPKPKAAASNKRCCARCKKHLPKSEYSKNQWSKQSAAKCKSCITTTTQEQAQAQAQAAPPALIPVERTEAYRVRQNNTITPKDRLITYCDLGIIMDLGKMNKGILPEILHVQGPDGNLMVPYTITPYEYWGLPREGASYAHGSRKFKKKIRKLCEYFFQQDQNWIVKNPELVEPYFDEVVTEGDKRPWNGLVNTDGISWAAQVESLKSAIAYYRDNDALAEDFGSMRMNDSWQPPTGSDAYQVRSSNKYRSKRSSL